MFRVVFYFQCIVFTKKTYEKRCTLYMWWSETSYFLSSSVGQFDSILIVNLWWFNYLNDLYIQCKHVLVHIKLYIIPTLPLLFSWLLYRIMHLHFDYMVYMAHLETKTIPLKIMIFTFHFFVRPSLGHHYYIFSLSYLCSVVI